MSDFLQISTTTEKKEDAERIARVLVERRLAACVQIIGPIDTTYWWKGKVERNPEWLCLIKTRGDLYAEVERTIKEMHPYEVPEIVAVPIVEGLREYLEWVSKETGPKN
ncbi:MAG: divalent-cation tolerance protein CutA [Chloroflexi bacterium]|nr:divalent-cation tolerance protein CutA [Chloroflexota bacterium]